MRWARASRRGRLAAPWLAVVLALGIGCAPQEGSVAPTTWVVDQTHEAPGARVRVQVDRDELSVVDTLWWRIEVDLAPGWTVEWPAAAQKLDRWQFGVLETRSEPPRLTDDDRRAEQQRYRLEPIVSGTYELPALTFVLHGPDEAGGEIVTDPIPITVSNPQDAADADRTLAAIRPVLGLPGTRGWWLAGAVAALLLAVALAWWWRRRKTVAPSRIDLPVHVAAQEALRLLANENLLFSGQVKLYYEAVSLILRRYLERGLGLRAAEQTTEEFLAAAGGSAVLTEQQKLTLKSFLVHCDLVKFARYAPTDGEVRQTVGVAEQFLAETADVERRVDVTDGNPFDVTDEVRRARATAQGGLAHAV